MFSLKFLSFCATKRFDTYCTTCKSDHYNES